MVIQAYLVGVRFEIDIVAKPYQGNDEPHLLGEFLPQRADPVEDAAFLSRVHKAYQSHTDKD